MDPIPSNLPPQLTSFVGRERELSEARVLLGANRLVTLTGTGGSGKTRLSIQLATETACEFGDGVYFIPLAPLRDPGLVASSIAQNLGLRAASDRSLMDRLVSYLLERRMLIVLDNFEHVLDGASVVAELLKATRAMRILVTSRSPLHVLGEQEYPVPPLRVPDVRVPVSLLAVADCESVRLFEQRASAILPGFAIDATNFDAIAHIVGRLDGLPLAIELAAARVKLLSPEAILARLEHSLGLLVGGARDLPGRQQTLRGTIVWSYQLLSEEGKRLLATCSVFRGGASLETIESVCQPTLGVPVLDGLQELADHSLLRRAAGQPQLRYSMLETIREFAAERLGELPEMAEVRERHAAHFLALAAEAVLQLTGPREPEWVERLDLEHDNIRAAIDWHRGRTPDSALRLAAAMASFWSRRGHFAEGRQRLRTLLDLVPGLTTTRVRALNGAAWLAIDQGDYRSADDLLEESIALASQLNDTLGEGMAVLYRARSKIASGRASEAGPDVERATSLLRAANDPAGLAFAMLYAGLEAQFTGRVKVARDLFVQGFTTCGDLGFRLLAARLSQLLGIARVDLGDFSGARAALKEGLLAAVELGDRWIVPIGLAGFAGLAARTGRPRLALRLAGAAAAYSESNQFSVPKPNQATVDRWLAPVRKSLGAAADRVYAEGRNLSLEQAVASALANEPEEIRPTGPTLTPRELEVATLAAQGLTNRYIASQLYLSVRTVDVHVDHILTKLGFHSRTQLAA